MISINSSSEVDIVLEILRQSQSIRTNIQNKEDNKALGTKESYEGVSYDRGASLRRADNKEKAGVLSKKHHNNQQRKQDNNVKTRAMIEGLLSKMTAQDYQKLSEEGFKPEDLTIEALSFAVQLIKDYSSNTSNSNKVADEERIEKKDSAKVSEDIIKKRMEAENLPVNKDSIDRVLTALKLSEDIAQIDRKDVLYLLDNELAPTVENLYKAKYSSQGNEAAISLSDDEWKELIPKVNEIIGEIDTIAKDELLDDAKWIIENNAPLTKENIRLLTGIKELKDNYSKDMIFNRILKGIKEGLLPADVNLIELEGLNNKSAGQYTLSTDGTDIKQLIEDIHGITEGDIISVVQAKDELTIKDLVDIREDDLTDRQTAEKLTNDKQLKLITAKRQLEEIRLKMTLEAANRLEKKGFSIETEALERVIERLRIEEEIYYKELYNQALLESEASSHRLLQLTSENINELKVMPSYVLGRTISNRANQTIPDLLAAGRSLILELDKAKDAYETLFTVPKAEYGDSIKKAFSNMGSLMEDMGIGNTEYNQRAIRILGYNRMDITEDSINQIKSYDIGVNYLLENLNPGIAIQIIKDGVNPLDVPIDELNSRIEKMKEEGYSSLDKYSSFLYKIEKQKGISEEERKTYIGIYRLLYQIEKSDGAALGALIKANQRVTLNNLLTALNTNKKGAMDYKIDDGFGSLQELSFKRESISDQLSAVFNDKNHESSVKSEVIYNNDSHEVLAKGSNLYSELSAQNEIQGGIIKELLNSLTPGKLHQLHTSIQNQEAAWETLGNMSTEQLLEHIRNMQRIPEENQAYYHERLRELQEVYKNSDQSIRFLDDYKLPCTTTNLVMTEQLLSNSKTVFKKLFGDTQNKEDEKDNILQNSLKIKLDLTDKLIDNNTMTEAYEQLEQEMRAVIDEEAAKDNISLDNLNQLRSMGMQMHFLSNLAKREFYQIPLEASGKITNINLTIIRGKSSSGRVTVTLISESLGSIRAEASLKENKLSGYIACDSVGGLKIIEAQMEPLRLVAQEEGIAIKHMNFCLQQASDMFYSQQRAWDPEGEKNPDTERVLYRVAKAMIQMIRSAEESDSAVA